MKILNISANDEMGARFNGFDIHDALGARNVQSELGCFWNHTSKHEWVFNIFPGTKRRLLAEVVRGVEVTTGRQSTFQWWSKELLDHQNFKKADVVHLQVIHDHFFHMESIAEIVSSKPTLWTWHDLWPVTGHCIFPVDCHRWEKGCGSCPDLLSPLPVFRDRTRQEYLRKIAFLSELNVDVHVTTQWMKNKLQPHLKDSKVKLHVFPFGIDLNRFSPRDGTNIRKKLGISEGTFCVFARATSDERKGFLPLVRALDQLSKRHDIVLITSQTLGLTEKISSNLRAIEFPWTNNSENLIDLYAACDVFAMPSVGESFGMMALEAMACGKPVLTVEGTATAEVVGIQELEVGTQDTESGLLKIIESLILDRTKVLNLSVESRKRAEDKYSLETYLDNLTNLYQRIALENV